jgi:hypothetical protein
MNLSKHRPSVVVGRDAGHAWLDDGTRWDTPLCMCSEGRAEVKHATETQSRTPQCILTAVTAYVRTQVRKVHLNRGSISSLWKQHESQRGLGKLLNPVIAVGMQKAIASCLEPP